MSVMKFVIEMKAVVKWESGLVCDRFEGSTERLRLHYRIPAYLWVNYCLEMGSKDLWAAGVGVAAWQR